MKENLNREIVSLKKSKNLLYLSHVKEEVVKIQRISPTSLFVKKNSFFNTVKYQINVHFKPIIIG